MTSLRNRHCAPRYRAGSRELDRHLARWRKGRRKLTVMVHTAIERVGLCLFKLKALRLLASGKKLADSTLQVRILPLLIHPSSHWLETLTLGVRSMLWQ